MASLKELKGRIVSVKSTQKITRAMELIASSRIIKAQQRVSAARPYAEALRQVLGDLVTPDLAASFPLLSA